MSSSYYVDDTIYQSLSDADTVIVAINGSTAAAAASAVAAAASAASAAAVAAGFTGTSTTSVAIATGEKSFTADLNKLWIAGSFLTLASAANSANYMHGSVTSYNSTTGALVMNVLDIGGSGTLADWGISLSGTQGSTGTAGATGATGPSGATGVSGTPTVNQLATWLNATTVQGVSITGLVKGNGASAPTAAVVGTDYPPIASPTFTGTPAAPTAAVDTNTTQLATMASVLAQAASATPLINATVAVVGTSTRFARGDHVHPTDTTRLEAASNLSDLANAGTARTNLGLGTSATVATGTSGATVPLLNGKNTWTSVQTPTASALTSGAGSDFSTSQIWTANVNGSTFTFTNPTTNPPTGSFIGISITFTTANAVAWGVNFKTTGYTASTSGKDFLTFYWNGTTYELVGVRNGTNA